MAELRGHVLVSEVAMNVSLQDVVDAMEMSGDESASYLNVKTGEIMLVTDELADLVEDEDLDEQDLPDWQREALPKIREVLESDDFMALPGKVDIHEWAIMERFSTSQTNAVLRDELMDAIHGAGAFRRFGSAIRRLGIEDSWFAFRLSALEEIAKDWLTEHNVQFR